MCWSSISSRRNKAALALLLLTGALACGEDERLKWVTATLEKGNLFRQQKALGILGGLDSPEAERLLLEQFQKLEAGTLPLGLWLEVLEAAGRRETPEWKARLAAREKRLAADKDPLLRYRECLEGGDAVAGETVFNELPGGCLRCHTVSGKGGAIGPDLTGLGQRSDRITTLESIIQPSVVILMGYDQIVLTLKGGEIVAGVRSFESRDEIEITSVVDGTKRRIPTKEIAETTGGLPSAMPPGFGESLSRRALRDLMEYVSTTNPE